MPSPTGGPFYSERDNRIAPGYDQYGDEYGRKDYHRNKRPAGFNQYKFDHRFNKPMSQNIKGGCCGCAANSNMDSAYRNGSGSYPGGGFNNNGNASQQGNFYSYFNCNYINIFNNGSIQLSEKKFEFVLCFFLLILYCPFESNMKKN